MVMKYVLSVVSAAHVRAITKKKRNATFEWLSKSATRISETPFVTDAGIVARCRADAPVMIGPAAKKQGAMAALFNAARAAPMRSVPIVRYHWSRLANVQAMAPAKTPR